MSAPTPKGFSLGGGASGSWLWVPARPALLRGACPSYLWERTVPSSSASFLGGGAGACACCLAWPGQASHHSQKCCANEPLRLHAEPLENRGRYANGQLRPEQAGVRRPISEATEADPITSFSRWNGEPPATRGRKNGGRAAPLRAATLVAFGLRTAAVLRLARRRGASVERRRSVRLRLEKRR